MYSDFVWFQVIFRWTTEQVSSPQLNLWIMKMWPAMSSGSRPTLCWLSCPTCVCLLKVRNSSQWMGECGGWGEDCVVGRHGWNCVSYDSRYCAVFNHNLPLWQIMIKHCCRNSILYIYFHVCHDHVELFSIACFARMCGLLHASAISEPSLRKMSKSIHKLEILARTS